MFTLNQHYTDGADGIASRGLQVLNLWKCPNLLCLKDDSACKFVLRGIIDLILYLNLKFGDGRPGGCHSKQLVAEASSVDADPFLLFCCLNPNVNLVFSSEDELVVVYRDLCRHGSYLR